MIITRKIQLYIVGEKEERNDIWKYLRQLNLDVFRAYNLVISNQYFNDNFKERILKTDEELAEKNTELKRDIAKINAELKQCKDADQKKKLIEKRKKLFTAQGALNREARTKSEHLYLTSEQNTTYQLLGEEFPEMPSAIKSSLNLDAATAYGNDAFEVKRGLKSIRSYRKDVPIPFQKTSMRFFENEKKEIGMNWLNGITFLLNFGRDKSNNREIINRAMNGTYKYSDSKIQIKDNDIYLLFCVDIPEEKKQLDPNIAVGVNLGLIVPAYCSLSSGHERLAIGSAEDLLHVRLQMQSRRRRLQKSCKMAKGGRGRQDKLKALERISEKESNYARTYNHMISNQIVKFALDNGAGIIKMELLEGYGEKELNQKILRNWGYFQLHQMTEYKAKKYGIAVKYTDPYQISYTCNVCKTFNEENLETRNDFVCKNPECKNFNVKVFSDYNAALNNAQSAKIVEKKEDCEYHKKYEQTQATA